MQNTMRFGISWMRRFTLATLILASFIAGVTVSAAAASPSKSAEQYVDHTVKDGLKILTDSSLSKVQRRDKFQDFLTNLTDLKAIAAYTLGQYRRGADPKQVKAFEDAYEAYALAVYRTYFSKFSGQSLKVTGSYKLNSVDSVVKTVLVHADGTTGKKPIRIYFRVREKAGKTYVVDISLEGVWLRQTQRDDFTGYLGQHGGNISALIKVLQKKTAAEVARAKAEK